MSPPKSPDKSPEKKKTQQSNIFYYFKTKRRWERPKNSDKRDETCGHPGLHQPKSHPVSLNKEQGVKRGGSSWDHRKILFWTSFFHLLPRGDFGRLSVVLPQDRRQASGFLDGTTQSVISVVSFIYQGYRDSPYVYRDSPFPCVAPWERGEILQASPNPTTPLTPIMFLTPWMTSFLS
jgi:hypothetical protein